MRRSKKRGVGRYAVQGVGLHSTEHRPTLHGGKAHAPRRKGSRSTEERPTLHGAFLTFPQGGEKRRQYRQRSACVFEGPFPSLLRGGARGGVKSPRVPEGPFPSLLRGRARGGVKLLPVPLCFQVPTPNPSPSRGGERKRRTTCPRVAAKSPTDT